MTDGDFKLERRRLGRSDLEVTSVGLGAWSWGATRVWGYGKRYGRQEVEDAWWKSIEMGVNFVDTASVYGNGESERIIGDLLKRTEEDIIIATKYFPLHMMTRSVRGAAERSLRRLDLKEVDLYQVHFPPFFMSLKGTMREMERLVREGKVRHIGVSNFNVKQLEAARSYLSREDVVSNQIHYNVVNRLPERNGMIEHARREGVTIIAYSPIAMGLLTGKYNLGNRPGGIRRFNRKFSRRGLRQVAPFLAKLREMASPECGTMAQASLAWLLKDPNVVVIPGAKNPRQAEENAAAAACSMSDTQVQELDHAYARFVPGW
ncbi:MAG: aldo/keto reductase [Thermoplasmata archaeon]|nr:MAG: aldo/keto reductase [Thermoplasmata archaeon]